jgi:hypothetical protein
MHRKNAKQANKAFDTALLTDLKKNQICSIINEKKLPSYLSY